MWLIYRRKKSVRRDSLHRRVSTSGDQSTLDLEDELFSPTVKLDESWSISVFSVLEARRSLHGRNSVGGESDSSFSLYQDSSMIETNNGIQSRRRSSRRSISDCDSSYICLTEESDASLVNMATPKQTQRPSIATEMVLTEESPNDEECIDWDELDDESYSYSYTFFFIHRMLVIQTLPSYDAIDKSLIQHDLLPPKAESSPPFTLVLDLDETLVHCVMEPIESYDIKFDVNLLSLIHCRFDTVMNQWKCMPLFVPFYKSF